VTKSTKPASSRGVSSRAASSRGTSSGAARPQPSARRAAPPRAAPPVGAELDAAILSYLRRTPNRAVDLSALAAELGIEPFQMQLAVERLHRRRMLIAPFIEPGSAGGAELTEVGSRWLLAREGGKPKQKPVALVPARERVRAEAEAARLPRAKVYGTGQRQEPASGTGARNQ
jgi:hypothetical protein